ncbi:hypothetical protein C8R44DRAFT_886850 [Mycena epipterygia]|nr:hypothetical protein C8R44DRAFT_886850 [Mycena epipterygia]
MPSTPANNAPDPVRNPCHHIQVLRDLLFTTRVPKAKVLTAGAYDKCTAVLDMLSSLLGDANYLVSTLNTFKLDLMGEINTTAPMKSTPSIKPNEFTISLDKAANIFTLPQADIKGKVEATIAVTGIEKLCRVVLTGVR